MAAAYPRPRSPRLWLGRAHRLPPAPAARRGRHARRSATSPRRTSTATCAAAEAAGIAELGVSEHVHRFRQALDLWRHPFWEEQARDDLDAYCEFVRGDAAAARDRVRLRPRRRGPDRDAARGPRLRLRRRLGPLRRRRRGRPRGLRRLGAARRPRRGLAPLLRDARRVRPLRPLRHPRPPGPGQGLGRRPAAARRATRATTTSPRSRRSPRAGSRSRSRPPACASRSASSTRRPPSPRCASRPGRRFALSSDAHLPEQVGFGYDRALEFLERLGVDEICVFEGRRRRLEPLGAAVGARIER